ncbi:hypothetical protein T484DRAFT_1922209 [Baffinella frigidus]|nr:hypothetical protein T484DRAFT_1922209 [Cryptophyta sp. CCMP2293]
MGFVLGSGKGVLRGGGGGRARGNGGIQGATCCTSPPLEDSKTSQTPAEIEAHRRWKEGNRQAIKESCPDPLLRHQAMVSDSVAQRRATMTSGSFCPGCWLPTDSTRLRKTTASLCICEPTLPNLASIMPHRLIIYCHYKEFGRISNTGGLLQSVLPPPFTEVYIAGLPEDEAALDVRLSTNPGDVIVFWPTGKTKAAFVP